MLPFKKSCDLGFEVIVHYLTNSKEQSCAWEANTFSATQEIPHILEARRFISVLQEPTPSWINTWYLPYIFLKIHFNIMYHLCLGLPTGFFPLCFPAKTLYKFIFFPIIPILHPFHPSCSYYPDNIWQGVQVLKLVINAVFPDSCWSLTFTSTYSLKNSLWETLSLCTGKSKEILV